MNFVHQLVDLEVLERTPGEMPVLKLNAASWEVMGGRQQVRLLRPATAAPKRTQTEVESWEGVDPGLFEDLRALRRELAEKERAPAFAVFGDATLRELARIRPTTVRAFGAIRGVGQKKLADYGTTFCERIRKYCQTSGVPADQQSTTSPPRRLRHSASAARRKAFELFARGASVEDVVKAVERARSTVSEYLAEYIMEACPEKIDGWVPPETYRRVAAAAARVGAVPLKPIFDALDGKVPYDTIRLVARHLETLGADAARG
jgi:ATP-dependent DNA helicase RecQ